MPTRFCPLQVKATLGSAQYHIIKKNSKQNGEKLANCPQRRLRFISNNKPPNPTVDWSNAFRQRHKETGSHNGASLFPPFPPSSPGVYCGLSLALLLALALDDGRQVADGDLDGEVDDGEEDGEEDVPASHAGDETTSTTSL